MTETSMSLKEGDLAPDFSGLTQSGALLSLKDFKGQTLVLYFYPKDDTPGCTKEACRFRDDYSKFKKQSISIVGVSPDSVAAHEKFIQKYQLPFTLIADTDKKIVKDYGVWVEKSMYGKKYMGVERSTFVIDTKGSIKKIYRKVHPTEHIDEILKTLAL